jgi:hypothetical protein
MGPLDISLCRVTHAKPTLDTDAQTGIYARVGNRRTWHHMPSVVVIGWARLGRRDFEVGQHET